jgi:hypothetical protein
MADRERLHFRIGLSATMWQKSPEFCISLDQHEMARGLARTETKYIEFDHDIEEGSHVLSVHLLNKDDHDVVKDNDDPDHYTIVKDMLLHIESIEIDEIDLGHLPWQKSRFVPHDSARPVLEHCVDLGWNGEWLMEFDSPFYIWLLENI